MTDLPLHYEASATIARSAESIFAMADEPDLMTKHMGGPSLMMGGCSMRCELDALGGKATGSVIRLAGTAFGLTIAAEEVVEARVPPTRKVWATIGMPQLVVIQAYRMGFEITPSGAGNLLRVWIDYALPGPGLARWLARAFGGMFASWCVNNMVREIQHRRASEV